MNRIKWSILSLPVVLASGCASPARMENMVHNSWDTRTYDKALAHQVNLASVSGGEKTNPLWVSKISNEAFSEAVRTSLIGQGLFSETGRYHLQIEMKLTDQPMAGLNLTVTTVVNYELTDSLTDTVVFNQTIEASYTATVRDSFLAVQRLRLANEGSGKENIKKFLVKLSELKIAVKEVSFPD